jgi:acetyl esterase/lipase
MQEAGVALQLNETNGTVHGFELNTKSAITEAAIVARIAFLQSVLAP